MYREFKKTLTDSSNYEARKINLRTYNVIIRRNIFIAKKTYYHHIFQKYFSDIKNTWSIIKNLLHNKKKSNLSPNKIKIYNILNENIEVITNSFNKYFVNIGPDLASNIKDRTPSSYKTFLKNPASSRFHFIFLLLLVSPLNSLLKIQYPKLWIIYRPKRAVELMNYQPI